jgi:hypothetical protein
MRWLDRPVPDLEELRALANPHGCRRTAGWGSHSADPIACLTWRTGASSPRAERRRRGGPGISRPRTSAPRRRSEARSIRAASPAGRSRSDSAGVRESRGQCNPGNVGARRAPFDHSYKPAEPNLVSAEVSDTGPGIPDSLRAHLFQSFFTTKKGGM